MTFLLLTKRVDASAVWFSSDGPFMPLQMGKTPLGMRLPLKLFRHQVAARSHSLHASTLWGHAKPSHWLVSEISPE